MLHKCDLHKQNVTWCPELDSTISLSSKILSRDLLKKLKPRKLQSINSIKREGTWGKLIEYKEKLLEIQMKMIPSKEKR